MSRYHVMRLLRFSFLRTIAMATSLRNYRLAFLSLRIWIAVKYELLEYGHKTHTS